MGSGADFFVPRHEAVQALSTALLDSDAAIVSAAVLSNCVRLESIYFTAPGVGHSSDAAKGVVSTLYASAVNATPLPWWKKAASSPLLPSSLTPHMAVLTGACAARHLLSTSCGLNNPARSFSPYTSRDSHILTQLKRTHRASAGDKSLNADLFNAALTSGKNALSASCVPEILALRPYVGRGAPGAPEDAVLEASKAAYEKAVLPAVEALASRIVAKEESDAVRSYRNEAGAVGSNLGMTKSEINRYLHGPTARLRRGEDVENFVDILKEEAIRLRNLYDYGEAIRLRNEAQIGSFLSEREQWEAQSEEDREVLMGMEEVERELARLEDVLESIKSTLDE